MIHANRKLYRYIHRRHHEYTAPVALIGIYAHIVEHFISNLLPFAFSTLIVNVTVGAWHLSTWMVFLFFATVHVMGVHSGYTML